MLPDATHPSLRGTPLLHYAHNPWVGDRWQSSSPRLLLLGDSHYLTDLADDSPELTRDIVRGVRDGQRVIPFYAKAAALVDGQVASSPDGRHAFWNRVAFFNYVPTTVGTVFDAVPTPAMWEAGSPRFIALLEELRPTHVLSLGQRQWNHITFPSGWTSIPTVEQPDVRHWRSPEGFRIAATWVNHPSSRGFSVAKWNERVKSLLTT
jgi:hypothetical protein